MPLVLISELIAGAKNGQLVSFPTDTVPALASRPDCANLIFAAKERAQDKPLILMAGNSQDIWPYVTGTSEELEIWQKVAQKYWPGALTLVLPASEKVPLQMNPLEPTTIGVRVPDHGLARKILQQTGPLATTSANKSGQPALLSLQEIALQFPQVLALSPEEIETTAMIGIPSTVAKWTSNGWEILRQGAMTLSDF